MPGFIEDEGGVSSDISATRLSVVRTIEAILAAFSRAILATFAGSIIPASIISVNFSA